MVIIFKETAHQHFKDDGKNATINLKLCSEL